MEVKEDSRWRARVRVSFAKVSARAVAPYSCNLPALITPVRRSVGVGPLAAVLVTSVGTGRVAKNPAGSSGCSRVGAAELAEPELAESTDEDLDVEGGDMIVADSAIEGGSALS